MTRQFGLTQINTSRVTRPAASTGVRQLQASHGDRYASPNIIRLPAGSIRPIPPLESPHPLQSGIDVLALLVWVFIPLLWCVALGFVGWTIARAIMRL